MKLQDFPLLNPETIQLTSEGVDPNSLSLKAGGEAKVWMDDSGTWLAQDGTLVQVRTETRDVELLLQRKELPWLLVRQRGEHLYLQCAEATDWLPLDEGLEIGVDEKIADQLARAGAIDRLDVGLAVEWCSKCFVLEGSPHRIAALRNADSSAQHWQILGIGWRADLQREKTGKLIVNRLVRSAGRPDAWSLIEGEIRFVNQSAISLLLSEGQQAQLRQVVQTHGDYVRLWRRYSEQEWQRSLRQAAELGVISYSKCEEASQEGGVWRFWSAPDAVEKFHTAWQALESDGALALEVSNLRPDWHHARYQDLLQTDSRKRFRGRPRFEDRSVVIEADGVSPPDTGFIYLSLAGDRTVQERRQKALANIETSVRSLKLRYLLQGASVPAPRLTKHSITVASKGCFKNGSPTDSQKLAIKMALDTPDVALIIGPPGTGKTQVIAALSRELAALGGDTSSQHQILITSFQHDAVENALERSQVYDLPPVKVGQRNIGDTGVDPIKRWCDQQFEKVSSIVLVQDEKEGHVPLLGRIHRSIAALRHGQLDFTEQAGLLLSVASDLIELENQFRIYLPAVLRDDWQQYIDRLQPTDAADNDSHDQERRRQALRKIRSIRVSSTAFEDDGPDRIADALLAIRFAGLRLPPEDIEVLEDIELLDTLDEARAIAVSLLRDRWIDLLSDYRPPVLRHRLDADGLRLVGLIEDALEDKLRATRHGVGGVLRRYRDSFLNHPYRARETVNEYAMVVGATCQQAASVSMASIKSLTGIGDSGIAFDTVIIDEAARANPLDLFIPMSMAERRVILVGDHQQLPHLLEPDVEDEMAEMEELSKEQSKALKESLFERLWLQLKDREAIDGFPRVVMLDTQFRMHPILGDFVSKQFYESIGLARLKPGRLDSEFKSDIPGYQGKVCAWLDVPYRTGNGDKKIGTNSRVRDEEARKIADEAFRLLKECGPDTSIGIITFYSAQRDLIFEYLEHFGVAEKIHESGSWRVSGKWSQTPSGEERLRVGTVDGFQGKEFDVVLLSAVRANDMRIPMSDPDPNVIEKAANRKYGHLRLANRMNVAMSRQRSLLVTVGDSQMAQGAAAAIAVPALVGFFGLSGGEHGIVR